MFVCKRKLVVLILTTVGAGACAPAAEEPSASSLRTSPRSAAEWQPWEPSAEYSGKSLAEWATELWRWSFSWTSCDVPLYDHDGSTCGAFQDENSPVFFFMPGMAPTHRTRCVVPADKAVLVPLTSYSTDNVGLPHDAERSIEELEDDAETILSTMSDLRLVVDEHEILDLERYVIEPTRYSYDLAPEPNWYTCYGVPGVVGPIDPAVFTGYFVLMPPASVGIHTIEYSGVVHVDTEFGQDQTLANHVISTFMVNSEER